MNIILKTLLYSIIAIVFILILYIIIAFICSNISTKPNISKNAKHRVFVQTNGVHTDVIIEKAFLSTSLIKQLRLNSSTNYFAFGWGDKGFYLHTPEWKDLKVSTAINAMLLPSKTAIHITGYHSIQNNWLAYNLDDNQLENLLNYIYSSFKYENEKVILIPNHSYGDNDRFFEALGSYSCFKTCNTWTNKALKVAEIPTAIWTPFDWGVYKFMTKQ